MAFVTSYMCLSDKMSSLSGKCRWGFFPVLSRSKKLYSPPYPITYVKKPSKRRGELASGACGVSPRTHGPYLMVAKQSCEPVQALDQTFGFEHRHSSLLRLSDHNLGFFQHGHQSGNSKGLRNHYRKHNIHHRIHHPQQLKQLRLAAAGINAAELSGQALK